MDNGDDGNPCDDEDAAHLCDGGRQIIDVVKGHEGNGQIAALSGSGSSVARAHR